MTSGAGAGLVPDRPLPGKAWSGIGEVAGLGWEVSEELPAVAPAREAGARPGGTWGLR